MDSITFRNDETIQALSSDVILNAADIESQYTPVNLRAATTATISPASVTIDTDLLGRMTNPWTGGGGSTYTYTGGTVLPPDDYARATRLSNAQSIRIDGISDRLFDLDEVLTESIRDRQVRVRRQLNTDMVDGWWYHVEPEDSPCDLMEMDSEDLLKALGME